MPQKFLLFPILILTLLAIFVVQSTLVKGVETNPPFVSSQGRDLYLNGKIFKSVGVNKYNLLTRGGDPYIGCGGAWTESELTLWFDELEQMGVTSVRFWLFQNFTKSGDDLSRFDLVLSLADSRNIKVIPVFENQWADCTDSEYKYNTWYKGEYLNPYGNHPLSLKQYIEKIVSVYRDNPTIMMWQVMNEAESKDTNGNPDPQALQDFATDITSFIKSLDQNHLVSLGTLGGNQPGLTGNSYRQLHSIPTVDVLEFHDFHNEEVSVPTYLQERFDDSSYLNKPLIVGESGMAGNTTGNCPEGSLFNNEFFCYSLDQRAQNFKNKMEAFFQLGGAIYDIWMYRNPMSQTVDPLDFLNSDPLVQGIKDQVASFEQTPLPTPTGSGGDGLKADYFNNQDLTDLSLTRIDPFLNFNWGQGSPDPLIDSDTFSARWTGYIFAPSAGSYNFYAASNDGVKVWINDELIIDSWLQGVGEHTGTIYLQSATLYPIRIEYFEGVNNAQIKLSWAGPEILKQIIPTSNLYTLPIEGLPTPNPTPSPAPTTTPTPIPTSLGGGLTGDYFDNKDFTNLVMTRIDRTLDFNWGSGSPAPIIDSNTYSVRWTGLLVAPYTENYTFYAQTNDGVRLWINNQLVIDAWFDHIGVFTGNVDLTAGQSYNIKMEYYENLGNSLAQLSWSSLSTSKQVIPQANLLPNNSVLPNPSISPSPIPQPSISPTPSLTPIPIPTPDPTLNPSSTPIPSPGSGILVTGLSLINADTDLPIAGFDPIINGSVVNLALLPTTNLNIRANTNPANIGSVRFGYNAVYNFRTENAAPYALAGDAGGNFAPWTPTLGLNMITATPFENANSKGLSGATYSIIFDVRN